MESLIILAGVIVGLAVLWKSRPIPSKTTVEASITVPNYRQLEDYEYEDGDVFRRTRDHLTYSIKFDVHPEAEQIKEEQLKEMQERANEALTNIVMMLEPEEELEKPL